MVNADEARRELARRELERRRGGQPASSPAQPSYQGGTFRALTEGSHAGLMGGFDDEITAGMLAPVDAAIDWFKGDGFDIGRAYTRKQQQLDEQKQARREEHPVASITGEVAGGLALGSGAARAGLSVAARPTASAMSGLATGAAEGAAYGALYGAGEAAPGERLAGAGEGALWGAAVGGPVGAVGGALSRRSAQQAANAAAPTSRELADTGRQLYQASEAQGVRFDGSSVSRLRNKLKYAAGSLNDKLRPVTSGTVDDIDQIFGGPVSLEAFDEFRQGINLDLRKAQGGDRVRLSRMKEALDEFADTISPSEMTGGAQGVEFLKEARQNWARMKKAETVEAILDSADVKTGQYTQSGFANAIKTEMRSLYRQIQKGKAQGWTKEEVKLIRQMAKGGSPNALVNLLSKFAPRGVVSIGAGQVIGSALPGVGNIAVPLAGHVAGEATDRAAMAAAQQLRNAAATGNAPAQLQALPNRLAPLIPAGSEASTGTLRTR